MIDLRKEDEVFVVTMQAGENRFNRPFLEAPNAALDRVEANAEVHALVTTGGEEAVRMQVVDEAAPAGEVVPRALARAAAAGPKDRAAYAALKRGMYTDAIRALREGRIRGEDV